MTHTLMIIQAILSVLLILMVLVQFGKGAEAGLMGAADTVMSGAQRGNILTKITVVLSVLFFANSIYLAKLQSQSANESLLDGEAPVVQPFNRDAEASESEAESASDPKVEGSQESNQQAKEEQADPAQEAKKE